MKAVDGIGVQLLTLHVYLLQDSTLGDVPFLHVYHAHPGTSLHSYLASFNPALSLALKYSKDGKDFVYSMRPV